MSRYVTPITFRLKKTNDEMNAVLQKREKLGCITQLEA